MAGRPRAGSLHGGDSARTILGSAWVGSRRLGSGYSALMTALNVGLGRIAAAALAASGR